LFLICQKKSFNAGQRIMMEPAQKLPRPKAPVEKADSPEAKAWRDT